MKDQRYSGLISLREPKSPAAEAYRMIRTNLEYTGVDEEKKVLLFTSPRMKDGKTTTISNLAVILANAGERILLIDCDLRKPRIHKVFEIANEIGLTNIIARQQGIENAKKKFSELGNLDLITSGVLPPMPTEILSSAKMGEVLTKLREEYDYILLDTPPILSVADAAALSRYVDGVIIVSALDKTTNDEIKASKRALDRVDANILGVILTFAENNKRGYYYNYYYDYE
ncbi:MAG: CpsD/CapB family tyrosine-protein kinase [Clostridia bacterium]